MKEILNRPLSAAVALGFVSLMASNSYAVGLAAML